MQHLVSKTIVKVLAGTAMGVLVVAGAVTIAPQKAEASAAFSQQTGKACNYCHTAPPALNGNGKKFKAKGNKL